jgi:hypothetical protein
LGRFHKKHETECCVQYGEAIEKSEGEYAMLESSVILSAMNIRHTLKVRYAKPGQKERLLRTIEPYSLIKWRGARLLWAYQVKPFKGWRLFPAAQLSSASMGRRFKPRRDLKNYTFSVQGKARSKNDVLDAYHDLILNVMTDSTVTDSEAAAICDFRKEHKISHAAARGIHYSIFSKFLLMAIADGNVEQDEIDFLNGVNECLRHCGAGILE